MRSLGAVGALQALATIFNFDGLRNLPFMDNDMVARHNIPIRQDPKASSCYFLFMSKQSRNKPGFCENLNHAPRDVLINLHHRPPWTSSRPRIQVAASHAESGYHQASVKLPRSALSALVSLTGRFRGLPAVAAFSVIVLAPIAVM